MSSSEFLKIIDTKLLIEYLKDVTNLKAKKNYFLFRINKSYLIMDAIEDISLFLYQAIDSSKTSNGNEPFRTAKSNKK